MKRLASNLHSGVSPMRSLMLTTTVALSLAACAFNPAFAGQKVVKRPDPHKGKPAITQPHVQQNNSNKASASSNQRQRQAQRQSQGQSLSNVIEGDELPASSANSQAWTNLECGQNIGLGAQTLGFGFSFAIPDTDSTCEAIKRARVLAEFGYQSASMAALCQDKGFRKAFEAVGNVCPTSARASSSKR